ncbi:hypothetical protein AURDEDRAFT_174120 [Auricularia subglabra TFB-10046 SS5]|nr:hypothetical protein AURDEDRAFT_174120 [Auricularia subglabra TFB-10046 SS5]
MPAPARRVTSLFAPLLVDAMVHHLAIVGLHHARYPPRGSHSSAMPCSHVFRVRGLPAPTNPYAALNVGQIHHAATSGPAAGCCAPSARRARGAARDSGRVWSAQPFIVVVVRSSVIIRVACTLPLALSHKGTRLLRVALQVVPAGLRALQTPATISSTGPRSSRAFFRRAVSAALRSLGVPRDGRPTHDTEPAEDTASARLEDVEACSRYNGRGPASHRLRRGRRQLSPSPSIANGSRGSQPAPACDLDINALAHSDRPAARATVFDTSFEARDKIPRQALALLFARVAQRPGPWISSRLC